MMSAAPNHVFRESRSASRLFVRDTTQKDDR